MFEVKRKAEHDTAAWQETIITRVRRVRQQIAMEKDLRGRSCGVLYVIPEFSLYFEGKEQADLWGMEDGFIEDKTNILEVKSSGFDD